MHCGHAGRVEEVTDSDDQGQHEDPGRATGNVSEWHGRRFVDRNGEEIGPDDLQVLVTKVAVRPAPDIELHGEALSQADELAQCHHLEMNSSAIDTEGGRLLARRSSVVRWSACQRPGVGAPSF